MTMCKIHVTDHAYVRMKQRLGLGKKAADRMAERACTRGLIEEEISGRLGEYLKQNPEYHNVDRARKFLYGEYVYVFLVDDNALLLVTVFQTEATYRARAVGLQRRMRKAG